MPQEFLTKKLEPLRVIGCEVSDLSVPSDPALYFRMTLKTIIQLVRDDLRPV